jgi:hypothetical protein
MVSRSESPIRKKIDPKEFNSILVKEETFLLHCTINELQLAFIPLVKIQERRDLLGTVIEPMESYISMVNVSFYEIPSEKSIDLILDLGVLPESIWYDGNFHPCILTIHKGKVTHNTRYTCYCPDEVTKSLLSINPNYINIGD